MGRRVQIRMKTFSKLCILVLAGMILTFAAVNLALLTPADSRGGRPWQVEISRLAHEIRQSGQPVSPDGGPLSPDVSQLDLSECHYVINVTKCTKTRDFYDADRDCAIRYIGGSWYRFDYKTELLHDSSSKVLAVNLSLAFMGLLAAGVLLFIRLKILAPFEHMTDVPYQLSKGNLTVPIKEGKGRFFGKFTWGLELLRENLEQKKQQELTLQRDKKRLLLSISHDIKTPLSVIKLSAKALSRDLYQDRDKQRAAAERIYTRADEIEGLLAELKKASQEDFLSLEVKQGEFYLSGLAKELEAYYLEKLGLLRIDFSLNLCRDCLLQGDSDRAAEVMQNIVENAIKYGDGGWIRVDFSEEENCILASVSNSGCTLDQHQLPHIFDSFWRGSNAQRVEGSGLGLYICRRLMHRMGGEVFAEIQEHTMIVTAVFEKA